MEKRRKKKHPPSSSPPPERESLDALFSLVSDCVSLISGASRSRAEMRSKLRMGRRAREVLRAQEERIRTGRTISSREKIGGEVDLPLSGCRSYYGLDLNLK